ncbi:iron-sulfur cluster assembly accessory protein [Marinilongibacter aquaticus]|uniref:HesB/IscA family protein n=1 Tax=Marinilongibacter aquaticus TaxID=2975157 RepID=UPI0021BDA568|nr:iron-sulfur cluster biosynthesis family protein [Marinilongibacter aquaticus]UBM60677.1 iron-sulfur cluster assembly accessory protein [Marinilongibacter aquaticus]
MIKFTASALERIRVAFANPLVREQYGLRVGLAGASCSGNYLFGLDKPMEDDEEIQLEGFRVLVKKAHLLYVIGKTVDYLEKEEESGFYLC